jgi:hypothetical protein
MQDTEIPAAAKQTQSRKRQAGCCPGDECCAGVGLRNNYYEGKRLTPDTFRVEQRYHLERRRLLNRAIHGWGVVYGYPIAVETRQQRMASTRERPRRDPCDRSDDEPRELGDAETRRLKIEDGLALDVCGRELVQVGCTTLGLDDVLVVDDRGRRLDPATAFQTAKAMHRVDARERWCWLLEAHYAEQNADPVQITDTCRCERDEWDHACETVRYSLRRVPCEACCREPECELDCRCTREGCCHSESERDIERSYQDERVEGLEGEARELERRRRPVPPRMRGGCRCICDHLTGLHPGEDCTCRLCEIDEMCGSVRVDLGHGVPLACVEVLLNDCDEWTFGPKVEVCGPRRFVKRNDLLFDLIQGCDLTRISRIGWADWHRREQPVTHAEFLAALGYDDAEQDIYVARDFWVEFSRPVKRETLRADCFAMTVLSRDERERWWTPNRVPIVDVELWPSEPETPQLVRGARIKVDGVWLYDAVRSSASIFHDHVTRVEFEVRGDFIVDCNDQTVDAEANGLSLPPTGNRSPGGTFRSTFSVAKSEDSERRGHRRDYAARPQGAER